MKKSRQYLVDARMYFATPYKGGPRPKLFGVWSEKRNRQLTGPCNVTKVKVVTLPFFSGRTKLPRSTTHPE